MEKTEILDALAESFGMIRASNYITKYSESTGTLYSDEEVAKQKIAQINTLSPRVEEKPKPDTLDNALAEFLDRKAVNADYEKQNKKLSGVYISKDTKARWNSTSSGGKL